MIDHLLEFGLRHYLLVTSLVISIILFILYETTRSGKTISNNELSRQVNLGEGVVIDIRLLKDYNSGHIVGSLNIPEDRIDSQIDTLTKYKDKTLILVDSQGNYSSSCLKKLVGKDFKIVKLSGGIASWRADNLPIKR